MDKPQKLTIIHIGKYRVLIYLDDSSYTIV